MTGSTEHISVDVELSCCGNEVDQFHDITAMKLTNDLEGSNIGWFKCPKCGASIHATIRVGNRH